MDLLEVILRSGYAMPCALIVHHPLLTLKREEEPIVA
jgi:hypothetical protein